MTRLAKLENGEFPPVTKEYRIFEVDKYGNKWFEMSFSGNPEIQKVNAENYVANLPNRDFIIEEI